MCNIWEEKSFYVSLTDFIFAEKRVERIACDTTTVRLVSSGAFDNSVTIYFRQLTEDDISGYMNVVCLTEDMLE